jgi:hypothetical protein
MSPLLTKAIVEQSAAKIAAFGPGGSGKSLTMTLLAIALSKTFHHGAPIVIQDTEGASDWLIDIYAAEDVELLRVKSRTFTDMRQALREAEAAHACAFISDSYSAPWAELQESLKKRLNVKKLEFHHMQELQDLWQEWVRQFLNSPLHCLFAGRLAYEWENDVDLETGKTGFHKAGTKMRSEKDAGYEPHLLIEMEAVRVLDEIRETKPRGGRTKKTRVEKKAGGHFLHRLHVLKDRARVLNGRMFEFKDINDYQPGDWKTVYDALAPHFARLNIGGGNHAIDGQRSSAALFDQRGESDYNKRTRQVQIALEEIDGTVNKIWPGQDAKSKALRNLTIETLFKTRSWTAVEAKSLEALEAGRLALTLFEEAIAIDPEPARDAVKAVGLLEICEAKIAEDARVAQESMVL